MAPDERRRLLARGRVGPGRRVRSRSDRAASPRTARITPSPACTSRCSTCPPDDLPAATDRCLASADAARVAEYEPAGDGRMAVIIQRMVAPAAAGVALTADPINGDRQTCVVTAVRGIGDRLVSGEAIGDEWVDPRRRSRDRSPAAGARDRSPPGAAGRERGTAHRGRARNAAGHRVGDRRRRHALDPPGQADDGAAAGRLVGRRRRPAPTPACSASASGSASRSRPLFESWLLTAMEDRMHALLPGADRPDRAAAVPRRRQRLVLLLDQLHLRRRPAPQPAGHARAPRPHSAPPRGDHPAHRSAQLPDHRADVARGPAAALPGRGRGCRTARRERCRSPSSRR